MQRWKLQSEPMGKNEWKRNFKRSNERIPHRTLVGGVCFCFHCLSVFCFLRFGLNAGLVHPAGRLLIIPTDRFAMVWLSNEYEKSCDAAGDSWHAAKQSAASRKGGSNGSKNRTTQKRTFYEKDKHSGRINISFVGVFGKLLLPGRCNETEPDWKMSATPT